MAGTALSFPLPEEICKELISKAKASPFGIGTETLIDPGLSQFRVDLNMLFFEDVRSGWEFDATCVKFQSDEWNTVLEGILQQVKHVLFIRS